MSSRKAIIIGAGPAGLTAAYELLQRTDIIPVVFEAGPQAGGICRTVNHNGNRIDLGGHRFFSKSDRVMDWWLKVLPLQSTGGKPVTLTYHNRSADVVAEEGPDPSQTDRVMLLRRRRSRIFFSGKFFNYPVQLNASALRQLGAAKTLRIAMSYAASLLCPVKEEKNLEDFFINRFGRELYETFFKSYTEKVWGLKCTEISAEWGRQRIKGLSVTASVMHFFKKLVKGGDKHISQKATETSLIEQFLYPKYGPGHLWETVAAEIEKRGGKIWYNHCVNEITVEDGIIKSLSAENTITGETITQPGDYFFSTMAVKDLIPAMGNAAPFRVREVAKGLEYRDFITVGLLLNKMNNPQGGKETIPPDNWIYIQEPGVKMGRVQIFNNWSPYMVKDSDKAWVGVEYFCNEGDALWTLSNEDMAHLAEEELIRTGLTDAGSVSDHVVIRLPKAYPAYFGSYRDFGIIKEFTDLFPNLFLIGRNGMHRYNNQDHSMLTAMRAVDNIVEKRTDRNNLWEVNTEEAYHEER